MQNCLSTGNCTSEVRCTQCGKRLCHPCHSPDYTQVNGDQCGSIHVVDMYYLIKGEKVCIPCYPQSKRRLE